MQDRFRSMFDETFVRVIQVITGYFEMKKEIDSKNESNMSSFH